VPRRTGELQLSLCPSAAPPGPGVSTELSGSAPCCCEPLRVPGTAGKSGWNLSQNYDFPVFAWGTSPPSHYLKGNFLV